MSAFGTAPEHLGIKHQRFPAPGVYVLGILQPRSHLSQPAVLAFMKTPPSSSKSLFLQAGFLHRKLSVQHPSEEHFLHTKMPWDHWDIGRSGILPWSGRGAVSQCCGYFAKLRTFPVSLFRSPAGFLHAVHHGSPREQGLALPCQCCAASGCPQGSQT